MADISVWQVDDVTYEAEIDDGGATTKLTVVASSDEMHEIGFDRADPEELVREAVDIIVEQGATHEIAHELTLGDLAEYAPAWVRELRGRFA